MEDHDGQRLPNNAAGKYFTTEECDGCAYCAAVAPENFDFDKPTNTYFIGKQPETPEEEEMVIEAMDDCPVDAIRREGDVMREILVEDGDNGRPKE
ncbi:MAG: ferredoxin [Ignavibacteriae bacterium]|nr:ferredoxin [Ignavibacteriota bacterium]